MVKSCAGYAPRHDGSGDRTESSTRGADLPTSAATAAEPKLVSSALITTAQRPSQVSPCTQLTHVNTASKPLAAWS
eukprot:198902-Prymnesium_polylepis.1